MWVVMMVAMMLLSLVPMLWPYRQAVGSTGETRKAWLTTLVGVDYFFVWTLFGMAVSLGASLAAVEMHQPVLARTAPIAAGVVVLIAGAMQFTSFKAHHLGCCRVAPGRGRALPADAGTALRYGLGLGLHCTYCCAGFTAVLLVIGIMDLRAMALVAVVIIVERFAPRGELAARAVGVVAVGLAKRRAVPFRERPWRQELALSPLEKSVLPRNFLIRCRGRIHLWLREVLGEPGARPRARVHTGEKLRCKCGTLV
jgi:predicted metal-binding membrane protein